MDDLERIELAARRTAAQYDARGDHEGDLLCDAFRWFADEILHSRVGAEEEN